MPLLPSWHFTKNLLLLSLSLILLPLDTLILAAATLYSHAFACANPSSQDDPLESLDDADRKTVLITGVNMAKGLALARLFHRRGHRVIGADAHQWSIGSVSRAVHVYERLPPPAETGGNDGYLDRILQIVEEQSVDLWVSVSEVDAAVEDAMVKEIVEARTGVKAVQFGVREVRLLHEKDSFMEHVKSLGLRIPDTQVIKTRDEVVEFLRKRGGLSLQGNAPRYLLKPIGVDDLARFSMPLLPLSSEAATLDRLSSVPFQQHSTYILQEFIAGDEFCTHALIIRGQVRAFVACPSSDVLMHYIALPADSPLSMAMLEFTRTVARANGDNFTGHMSFDFLVKKGGEKEGDVVVYPIECNPRVHTAVVLFNDTPQVVDEYLSILSPPSAVDSSDPTPITPFNPDQYFWIGQDLIELVIYPLYLFLFARTRTFGQLVKSTKMFVHHAMDWKDGTFEIWDPLPWWWLYHVYWPVRFFGYLKEGSWQQLNVSTGKAFKAS